MKSLNINQGPDPYQVMTYAKSHPGTQKMLQEVPKTGKNAYEANLLTALAKKFLKDHKHIYGTFNWNTQNPQERDKQIQLIKFALIDDAPEEHAAKPGFWSRLWGTIKKIIPVAANFIPGVGPIISKVADSVLNNPTAGHLAEVGPGVHMLDSIRNDRKEIQAPSAQYKKEAVNSGYLLSHICPEVYNERQPNTGEKTSLGEFTQIVSVNTNSNGDAGYAIYPENIMNNFTGNYLDDWGDTVSAGWARAQP